MMQFVKSQSICNSCLQKIRQLYLQRPYSNGKKKLSSKEVRASFLDYFCQRNDHKFVRSSSVIPGKDQGTYFTNAGMNQFKPIFLGNVPPDSDMADYKRVANSQKCVRIGGKHNDLDEVGNDSTHHTFFEMLGSWSFGDYFKKEACRMALELLTDVYKLPRDRLYFTYFGGDPNLGLKADDECREIWRELGLPNERILPLTSNFWDMGDVGPCGPCTEIHYDHIGSRDAANMVDRGYPDVVEIWNLVFIHYNRQKDQSLTSLPSHHVDTGMGLERICAVLQGTMCNYETDLFLPIFDVINKEVGHVTCGEAERVRAYRIIADHVRMATVCIADGLIPGRDDLAHKLRAVIYRSLYQCHNVLGTSPGLMSKLVPSVVESLGKTYPEIAANSEKVQEVLRQTEERYLESIKTGNKSFNKFLKAHPGLVEVSADHLKQLQNGLYYRRVSADIVEQIATERGLDVDMEAYLELVHSQVKHATNIDDNRPRLTQDLALTLEAQGVPKTDDSQKYVYTRRPSSTSESGIVYDFGNSCLLMNRLKTPLEQTDATSTVVALLTADGSTDLGKNGEIVRLVLDKTQFYAESGGQKADRGLIKTETGTVAVADVQSGYGYVLHVGTVIDGHIAPDQPAEMEVDKIHRMGCMANHTATHLVNAGLRLILGDVKQRGSYVGSDKLTFDFACLSQITTEKIVTLETMVRNTIASGVDVTRQCMPLKDAQKIPGLVTLEDEVYQNEVFVVSVPESADVQGPLCQTVDLCGGTHVLNVDDIGSFCITGLSGMLQGTKRITCLTGERATRVIKKGKELEELYGQLEQAINSDTHKDQWVPWKHQITNVLSEEYLPKLARDIVGQKFRELVVIVNAMRNKTANSQLVKEIYEAMDGDDEYVLKEMKVKSLLRPRKLLKDLDVSKPTIVAVTSTKSSAAFIFMPQGLEAEMEEVAETLAKAVDGTVEPRTGDKSCIVVTHKKRPRLVEHVKQCLEDLQDRQLRLRQLRRL